MTNIDERIEELEEIRSTVDLSHKRARKNKEVLLDICNTEIGAPLADEYFAKKVSNYLAHSCFEGFSKVQSDDGIYYISDFGDEISFSDYKGMKSITYVSNDGNKSIKLYRSETCAFIKTEDYSKEEDSIVSGEVRVYDITDEPVFRRLRKHVIKRTDDSKTVVVELYEFLNNNLLREICTSTIVGDTNLDSKYTKIVDPTRYELKDGELYIIGEDDSKVIEKNNEEVLKLLRF